MSAFRFVLFVLFLGLGSSCMDQYKPFTFWKKIEELGVWNWYSKYPHKKPKYESLPDQVGWELKIINHEKYKLCKGYDYFPKNFKEFTKELSNLIGVEFKIQY